MNAFEILNFTKKYFPLVRPDNVEFDQYVKSILKEYIQIVTESETLFNIELTSGSKLIDLGRDKFIGEFKLFTNSIVESIENYLEGHPYKAFEKLNNAMSTIRYPDGSIEYIGGSVIVQNGSYQFYRIRTRDSKEVYSRQGLFHVPFSKRGKIRTSRYSIPGFPSLYLSNSIYVAWEELKRPKFEDIQASRFELNEYFMNLNLTTRAYCRNYKIDPPIQETRAYDEALCSVFRFPLVLACSVRVNNHDDVFKPEYIIPQMLLQWITTNSIFKGINYTSSHIDTTDSNYRHSFENYVIPAKTSNNEYCKKLTRMFRMSEPLSEKVNDLVSDPFDDVGLISDYKNMHIHSLKKDDGYQLEYNRTRFAALERALHQIDTTNIDF
jgi:hypothetical protein